MSFGRPPTDPYRRGPDGERICRSEFRGTCCGYDGPALWCDKTRRRCRAIGWEHRYGVATPYDPDADKRLGWLRWKLFILAATTFLCGHWVEPTWVRWLTNSCGIAFVVVPILVPGHGWLRRLAKRLEFMRLLRRQKHGNVQRDQ